MKTLPKKDEKNWSKIGIIVLGIGFALLFIGTYVMSILTGTVFATAIKPGDSVTIDFTVRDKLGRPIITTDQQIYNGTLRSGNPVFFTQKMTFPANQTFNKTIVGVGAYYPALSVGPVTFGMLGPELDLISAELVGMHTGETKSINLTALYSSSSVLSREEYEQLGGDYNLSAVGQMYPWSFADQPTVNLDSSNPPDNYYRIVEILDKTDDNITISYLYSTADIKVVSTNGQ
ncbi:MAG: hypothetical protein LUO93_11995 [Methanomicrobiales archaeon]|nr:hypothetical protein [Methanomicrobiales archaeon]